MAILTLPGKRLLVRQNRRVPFRPTGHASGPHVRSVFSPGFRELMDTRLGKEYSAAADHMILIGRTWGVRTKLTRKLRRRPLNFVKQSLLD
jgi:hypothetical protein